MPDGALTLSATRRLLDELGLKPRKSYGQNFLIDGNIVRKSIDLAEVAPGEAVVEVGPGLGTLTGALLASGCRVFAVEKDFILHQHLAETLAKNFPDTFSLMQGDAVDSPLGPYSPREGEDFKVVANLPYAISTPWMDLVLSGPLPVKMVLMLQQETVDRFSAAPGTKQYGAITVFLESAYRVSRGHKVARQCFFPTPEVDSYLFHLDRLTHPVKFDPHRKSLIRACFGQRRKQIGSLLRTFAEGIDVGPWLEKLEKHGFSRQSRPEEIPAALWREL
jgi:16S rRNA (adenine1518-N6/adenine1519-N6)-dimethyltransferase